MPPVTAQDDFPATGAALIFGGSGGLGAECTLRFAAKGVDVAFTYHRNKQFAAELVAKVEELGVRCRCYQSENSSYESVKAVVESCCEELGGIHTMVYSSGPHVDFVRPTQLAPDKFKQLMEEDVAGFFNMIHSCLPRMMAKGQPGGSIVAITTCATESVVEGDFLSAVPKAAVNMLVKHIAKEYAKYSIRANIVGPGIIETRGMGQRLLSGIPSDKIAALKASQPSRNFGTGAHVADMVVFLASAKAAFISG